MFGAACINSRLIQSVGPSSKWIRVDIHFIKSGGDGSASLIVALRPKSI